MQEQQVEIYNEAQEIEHLYASFNLSLDVRDFIKHNKIGQHLMRRTSELLLGAREGLENVDPTDVPAISKLQVDARAARLVLNTLGEIMQDGEMSRQNLESRDLMIQPTED